MKTFSIECSRLSKEYIKNAKDTAEVNEWIANHLDLSEQWIIREEKTAFIPNL